MDWLEKAKLVDNPYLREFEEIHSNATYLHYMDITRKRVESSDVMFGFAGRRQDEMRYDFTHKYSWAVPTPEALAAIAMQGKIIEAGAGSGYWSSLLRQMGVDVVAFDQYGTNVTANDYHYRATDAWTDIIKGDASTVKDYSDRALFMSYPPDEEPFGYDVLRQFEGNRFVYIGEGREGSTGDDKFFDLLEKRWRQLRCVEIPQWEFSEGEMTDALYVFRRLY